MKLIDKPHFYIIPGAGQQAVDYNLLNAKVSRSGYISLPIEIDWTSGSPRAWVDSANRQIREYEELQSRPADAPKAILGFSYGGIITLFADLPSNCSRIICSPPNVFNPELRNRIDAITRKVAGFKTIWSDYEHLKVTQRKLADGEDIFTVGRDEKEFFQSSMQRMVKSAFGVKRVGYAPKSDHNINSPAYVKRISEAFSLIEQGWDWQKGVKKGKLPQLTIGERVAEHNVIYPTALLP